ncbi:putative ribonuclease H-like domain-containing protein [Tanacetum coccineum]
MNKESDNSKENTDDSLKQQHKIVTKTSSVKSSLKVDKDWKEKFFYPANHVREEEPKKGRENNYAPIIEDWVSNDEEEVEPIPKVEKKTAIPTATKKESVKSKKPIRRSVSCPKHMVPRAVLMKTGLKTVNNARPVNTVRSVNTGKSFSTASTMTTSYSELGFLGAIYEGKTQQDLHTCLFACFLSQEEPKRVSKALSDPAWVEAMHEELLQFKLQKVWVLVDLPKGHRAIGTKWVYRNKKDKRGIVIRNKARLVAQGHTQEEGIDYDEVFAPVARIKAIRIFLAYASYMGFMVYQIDVKSAFLYGQIEEEVNVCQPLGFEDPDHPDKVYKVQQKKKGIFISQYKYVHEILRKYNYTDVKCASTPTDLEMLLVQDGDAAEVDEHPYRSMIGSLMYITASRPDIMFAVCACARFQDYQWELVAYTDTLTMWSFTHDRKSTTGGCQFLGNRLISWQCKKQTVVATSTTEADIVVLITATTDSHSMTITKASIRRHLKLDDHDGITSIPNSEIFEQLALMGYHTDSDKVKKLEARVKIGKAWKEIEKASTEMNSKLFKKVFPLEVIQDQESSEKGSAEVSTAGATKGTASEVPVVSTAEENISTAGRTDIIEKDM